MPKTKLQSERDTEGVRLAVVDLIEHADETSGHENCNPAFEHGHWWAICSACGASWSVIDIEANRQGFSLDLERIDVGDESCPI